MFQKVLPKKFTLGASRNAWKGAKSWNNQTQVPKAQSVHPWKFGVMFVTTREGQEICYRFEEAWQMTTVRSWLWQLEGCRSRDGGNAVQEVDNSVPGKNSTDAAIFQWWQVRSFNLQN